MKTNVLHIFLRYFYDVKKVNCNQLDTTTTKTKFKSKNRILEM